MKRTFCVSLMAVTLLTLPLALSRAWAVDTDGDGLLDLLDVPKFNPSATGLGDFYERGIQDLDGANQLTKLQILGLSGNQITSLEHGDFDGLTNLQQLDLWTNQITSLESGDFDGLTNLQKLVLNDNQITNIESGGFQGLTNLQILGLSVNRITSLESGDFDGLANLQTLELYGNQITSIERGDFDGLANLQSLSLNSNQITSLERGDFDGLANLQSLWLSFNPITSLERGDLQGLTNLQELGLGDIQITSVEGGDFAGLDKLQTLDLGANQITRIESGAFHGLTKLQNLYLAGNPISDLNLAGATFEHLRTCMLVGFCVDGNEFRSLTLDEATLNQGSYNVVVGTTTQITDASLVGLTFSDGNPANLSNLLGINSLVNVLVDPDLFNRYANELMAFDAIEGKSVRIIQPGDLDRDGTLTAADIDAMAAVAVSNPRDPVFDLNDDGTISFEDRAMWVHELKGTYFGDANLDGEFNSGDLVQVFDAGQYEDTIPGNSDWADGDWDGDGEFGSSDLVVAFNDGGYVQGPRAAVSAVPEPTAASLGVIGILGLYSCRLRCATIQA